MFRLLTVLQGIFFVSSLFAQHPNILISTTAYPNEPSISIDPKHPNYLVAASNIANLYYSVDTGKTWQEKTLVSSFGVWGDPAIIVDTTGAFYFFHLSNPPNGSWIDRIVCQKSTDHGVNWTNGSYTGLNNVHAQDKHWPVVDRSNNNIYVTWTQFDQYGSSNPQDSTVILFSKSINGGQNWSTPVRINSKAGDCVDSDNTVEGAVPAVGPNGEIYVAWAGPDGLVFDRSLDQGETWLNQDIKICDIPGGWDFAVSGIYRANGLPITVCDLSNGPNRGTIYINWSDQRNGENNTDVWMVKSTDGGNTWTPPIKVNNDNTQRQQFFTYMAVDQANGNLWFVFYDRRQYPDDRTDVYMALSPDGGTTFQNFKVSETPFLPNSGVFFGDYTNVAVHNNIVRPIWTRLYNGDLSVWTALVNTDTVVISGTGQVSGDEPESNIAINQNYPNPFSDETYISFKLRHSAIVSLKIYDNSGKEVFSVLEEKKLNMGKYVEKFNARAVGLNTGAYNYVLTADQKILQKKMIYIR